MVPPTVRNSSDTVICVVGGGYVGLVTAACLAEMGNTVRLVESDPTRLKALEGGHAPIFEPGLEELLTAMIGAGRFEVTADASTALAGAGVVFIAVGSPPRPDGTADLSQVRAAVGEVNAVAADDTVIAIKSTVPPGTAATLQARGPNPGRPRAIVACPEFLREGAALADFRKPPRVVVGGSDPQACARVGKLFEPLGTRIITRIPPAPS